MKRNTYQLASLLILLCFGFSKCDRKYFEGTRIKKINTTVEIAVLTIQEDQNYAIFYHTTTRPCKECAK